MADTSRQRGNTNTGLFPLVFDAEIAISLAVRVALEQRLLARLRHRKAPLCYEGIDGSQFNHLSETSEQVSVPNGLPPNRPLIGIVGRLAEQKGHTYILQAMPLIRRMIPAHLVVIGTGSLDATLQAEAQRLGVQDYVHFLGSRNDVLEILPHLDLIVSASLWEGLPAAILEAMTLGVPVVATDVSGSREVVQTGQTGILVPAADPAALAQATIALLTDRAEALRMAHNARQMAAQYTVQNAAPCYGEVYQKLIASQTLIRIAGPTACENQTRAGTWLPALVVIVSESKGCYQGDGNRVVVLACARMLHTSDGDELRSGVGRIRFDDHCATEGVVRVVPELARVHATPRPRLPRSDALELPLASPAIVRDASRQGYRRSWHSTSRSP